MIHVLTTARHTYPVGDYLKSWASPAHPQIKSLTYENLPTILPRSTYVFADLERLSPEQRALAAEARAQLATAGEGIRLLNDPARSLGRVALLEQLHAAGVNRFRVYRATHALDGVRFPVFVRRADEHEGSFSGLLRDPKEVDQAIVRLLLAGIAVENVLIAEFCDTSTDGLFRKYSAFRVGDLIVPRHLIFSKKWVQKVPDLLDAAALEEERRYLEANPHAAELRAVFDLAQIEYGRIDYGVYGGRVQVWEINTNPLVMMPRDRYARQHLPAQELFAAKIRAAFESIDATGVSQPMVAIDLSACATRIRGGGR
jgi:hypothetical protein